MEDKNSPSSSFADARFSGRACIRMCSVLIAFLTPLAVVSTFVNGQTLAPSSPNLPVEKYLSITAIPLYDGPAPGETSVDPATAPFLTVFPPQGTPNGTAVIIAPGGGYEGLASNYEGRQEAD